MESEHKAWMTWGLTLVAAIATILISFMVYTYKVHALVDAEIAAGKDPVATACAHNTQSMNVKCEDLAKHN